MHSLLRYTTILTLVLPAGTMLGSAQIDGQRIRDVNPHSWWVYYGDHPVKNSKWGVLTEI